MSIIIDEIHKCRGLISHMVFNQLANRRPCPLKQDIRRRCVDLGAEAGAELADAGRRRTAGRDEREEVGADPVRLAAVAAEKLDYRFVHFAPFEELHCWDLEAIVEDGLGVDAHGAGDLALDILYAHEIVSASIDLNIDSRGEWLTYGHVPKIRRPSHNPMLEIYR